MSGCTEGLAVYGGTFDPPHVGHVLAAAWALSAGGVDRVLVVPTYEHPLGKEPAASFDERCAMCELAMRPLVGVEVSRIEEELGGKSFTLRTLEALAGRLPNVELRLLVGADVLEEVQRWHRWDRVQALARPLVLGRAGYGASGESPPLPEVSSSDLRERLAAGRSVHGLIPNAVAAFIAERALYRGTPA